jgi:hypothetical protein
MLAKSLAIKSQQSMPMRVFVFAHRGKFLRLFRLILL